MSFKLLDKIGETTTTVGTIDFVLAGAFTGHKVFSTVGDTVRFPYHCAAVDANGNETGQWESGIGKYDLASNSVVRLEPLQGSSAVPVNFAAGTKRIALSLLSDLMYPDGVTFRNLETLSPGFDTAKLWKFHVDLEGWTPSNGTAAFDTANGKGILLTDNTASVLGFTSPAGLSLDGNIYRRVKASVTLTGLPAPVGTAILRYSNSGHSQSTSFQKAINYPVPFNEVGDEVILDFDMEASTDPSDWITAGPVTRLQLILTDAVPTGTQLRVNWVAMGGNRPPAPSTVDQSYILKRGLGC
jgi:hypothetical protein